MVVFGVEDVVGDFVCGGVEDVFDGWIFEDFFLYCGVLWFYWSGYWWNFKIVWLG